MDIKLRLETLAFVLLIVAFPVISIGTSNDHTAVWVVGLVAMILAGVLPILTRYLSHTKDAPRDMGMEFDDRAS